MHVPPQIKVGPFTIALLTDGLWRNDGGCMFGVVPRELWQRNHPPDEHNRIRLNLTCPLIIKGNDAVLIDTGIGNRLSPVERKIFSHGEGWLPDGLRALGMEPGDITHVVLSHLHFDHCGGVVRRKPSGRSRSGVPPRPPFRATAANSKSRAGRDNERLRAAYRHVEECLEPIAGLLEPIAGTTEVIPGVEAIGHRRPHHRPSDCDGPGGWRVLCPSGGYRADSFAHEGPVESGLRSRSAKDHEEKSRYLNRAIGEHWWISFAHDDRVLTAHVTNDRGTMTLSDIVECRLSDPEIE